MKIVYWSSTGNTERMAQMLGEEIEKLGGSAEVEEVSSVSPSALEKETVFALGCSAMGDEELDEGEMEPFVQEVEKFASGKKIGLFGSYDSVSYTHLECLPVAELVKLADEVGAILC